jgi:tight adherence protein C
VGALAQSPLVLWAAALACAALALRARRSACPARADDVRLPPALRLAAAVPVPARAATLGVRRDTAEWIARAGLGERLTPHVLQRARIGGAALAAAMTAVLAVAVPGAVFLVPAVAILAFLEPDRWLRARARRRRAAIVRELPDLLDLLAICVESGMALDPALRLAVERLPVSCGARCASSTWGRRVARRTGP